MQRGGETYTAVCCTVDARLGVAPDVCLDHGW